MKHIQLGRKRGRVPPARGDDDCVKDLTLFFTGKYAEKRKKREIIANGSLGQGLKLSFFSQLPTTAPNSSFRLSQAKQPLSQFFFSFCIFSGKNITIEIPNMRRVYPNEFLCCPGTVPDTISLCPGCYFYCPRDNGTSIISSAGLGGKIKMKSKASSGCHRSAVGFNPSGPPPQFL